MPTTDSNGIIRYLASDGAPTPPVLNLGMQSVSDALSKKGFYTAVDKADRDAFSAAFVPSNSRPLLVNRQDLPANSRFEWTNNGTTWYPLNSYPIVYNNSTLSGVGPFTAGVALITQILDAAPYPRKLLINGGLYGNVASGAWQGALSVNTSSADAAQRRAYFPVGSQYSSVFMSMNYILPANVATTVRLWFRQASSTGSISTLNDSRLNYLEIQSYTNAE